MSNNAQDRNALEQRFADIFALLNEQDIEQFYAHYQLWVLRRRVPLLEKQLESLREHLAGNQRTIDNLQPSALALAVLVRLQSNGVSDTDVLDLMLSRGEDWLDRMMQRLDYCEQVEDFIRGDYTQWCIRSLEGAYDWIDSLLGSIKEGERVQEAADDGTIVATEELLLQRLRQDDEEATPGVMSPAASESKQEVPVATLAGSEQTGEELPSETPGDAAEQQPELIGWKDLEDLEAPQGEPVPWYSVEVDETGASSSLVDSKANSMNDWIKVLQADETDVDADVAAYSETESPTTSDAAEIEAPASTLTDTEALPLVEAREMAEDVPVEVAAAEPQEASENDAESNIPAQEEAAQQQNASLAEEVPSADFQNADDVSQGEEALLIEVQSADDVSAEEEVTSAELQNVDNVDDEALLTATNSSEILPAPDETLLAESVNAENELAAVETSSSQAEILAVEIDQVESEPASSATNLVEAEALPGEDDHAGSEVAVATSSPDTSPIGEASEISDDTDQEQELSGEEATLLENIPVLESEANSSGEQEEDISKQETLQMLRIEPALVTYEVAEVMEDAQTVAPDPAAVADEVSEAAEEQIAAAAASSDEDKHAEGPVVQEQLQESTDQPEQPDISHELAVFGKMAAGHEIETAAIVNDILSADEEQENQLAWYEYLEMEELANGFLHISTEERIEPEKHVEATIAESLPSAEDTPAIYEYSVIEESANKQAISPVSESRITEEAIEVEGWQTWPATDADDETLPLALKDIQLAGKAQPEAAQEFIVQDEAMSPQDTSTKATTEDAGEAKGASSEPQATAGETGEPSEEPDSVWTNQANSVSGATDGVNEQSEIQAVLSDEVVENHGADTQSEDAAFARAETHTASANLLQRTNETGEESVPSSATSGEPGEALTTTIVEGRSVLEYQNISGSVYQGEMRAEQPAARPSIEGQPATAGTPPRKKPGFWRRLFRFGRKKS